jgi:hypothetical protein
MNEETNGQNYDSQNNNSQPGSGEQSGYSYGTDTTTQSGYNGQPNYNVNGAPQQEKPEGGIGFGVASLVLGIIALVTFCLCVNIPCAILAIIFGIIQLVRGNGKGLAIGGLITAGFSLVAMIVFWVVVGFSIPQKSDMSDWNSFMKKYEKSMDNYDYKYDDNDDNSTF